MELRVDNISKDYEGKRVLDHFSHTFYSGHVYGIMAPSGTGKTTLFRVIAGLERPDGGSVVSSEPGAAVAVVFQEDRLVLELDAVDNCLLVSDQKLSRREVEVQLSRILPSDSLHQPVSEFSGGMKRRTAIARAMLAPAGLILLDEPFTGLDEETKGRVIQWIRERIREKLVIFSTHQREDLKLLDAELIRL